MPTASRNEKKKRRQRRNISLLTRELRALNARHINAQFAILSALTGAGGAIIVSKENVAKAMADFRLINWKTERQDDGSMKISVVDPRTGAKLEVTDPAETTDRPDRSVTAQLGKKPCTKCGGAGVIVSDTIVGGTEHDTVETPCEHCKDTEGYEPDEATDAQRPA